MKVLGTDVRSTSCFEGYELNIACFCARVVFDLSCETRDLKKARKTYTHDDDTPKIIYIYCEI